MAHLAKVPLPIKEVYETTDRNYLMVVAEVVNKVVDVRERARKTGAGNG